MTYDLLYSCRHCGKIFPKGTFNSVKLRVGINPDTGLPVLDPIEQDGILVNDLPVPSMVLHCCGPVTTGISDIVGIQIVDEKRKE